MKAVLLAAGYGTRLLPLTADCPKTLLDVAGKPMIEWILEGLARVPGLDAVALVTNDRFAPHHERWAVSYRGPLKPSVLNDGTRTDATKLGAVGDLKLVKDRLKLDDDLLVVAGDNLFEFDPAKFAAFFRQKNAAVVALKDMKGSPLLSQYGLVNLGPDQRMTGFEEKPKVPTSDLVSTCFYAFPRRELGLIDTYLASGGNPDAPGHYLRWLYRQTAVYGWVFQDAWLDIGDLASYREANERFRASPRTGSGGR